MSGGRRVARNVLFNVVSQLWLTLLVIVSVPIVLHGIGAPAYGVFVLASVVLGYTALLDLGLTPALVRSVAVHQARGNPVRLEAVAGTALSLLIVLGLVVGALIALLTPFAVQSVLHLPRALWSDARFVLYVAAVGFACNMVLLLFVAIAQGLQRLDLFASRTLVLGTLTAVGQILVVRLGGGLRGLAIVTIAVNVLSLVVFLFVVRRLLPGVSFRPRFDRSAFHELVGFGSMKFLNQVAVQGIFHVDRLIVAAFVPIAVVSYYSVPVSMCQKFVLVQQAVTNALFPAASELHTLGETERLRRLYLSAAKLGLVALLPVTILPSILALPILEVWIGPAFAAASAPILTVLAIAYGVVAASAVAGVTADATGHPDWSAAVNLAAAAVNITLMFILVPRFGAVGAAYALLATGLALLVAQTWVVHRWIVRVSPMQLVRQALLRPLAAGVVLAVYAFLLVSHLHHLLLVLAALAVGAALYLGATFVFRVWDERELALLRSMIRPG
jgi:O-antigen/teichoic acid export membrane protein